MRRPSLLLRIYGLGLAMLLGVGLIAALVGVALVRPQAHSGMQLFAGWVLEQVLAAGDEGARRHQLERARKLGLHVAVLEPHGQPPAGAQATPWAPLTGAERAGLSPGRLLERPDGSLVLGTFDGPTLAAVALVAPPPPPFSLGPPALILAASLLLFALLALPLARSLTRPLDRLTAVARRLGEGDLTARAPPMRDEELAALSTAFNEMADAIEGLRRAEKELLANVGHELRTPMARLRVVLELIADGDPLLARSYVGELEQDLGELERLTDDIIATARLELAAPSGPPQLALRREPVELTMLGEQSLRRLRSYHPDRAASLRTTGPVRVDADATLLRRALDNVLDNARKYSDDDAPIEVEIQADQDRVRLTVRDHGQGLDPDELRLVFTPFFRADRSRTRATGGVGLGLLLTRRIVEAHGGQVTLTSRPGEGTVVTFWLPRTHADTPG